MNWNTTLGFFRNLARGFRALPYRARHVAAWGFVKLSRAAGRSYPQIVQDMERINLIKEKSPFVNDVEGYIGMLERQASLIGWPDNKVPGYDQVVDMPFRRAEHFRWITRMYLEPGGPYQSGWRFVSLYTNRLMTPRELMSSLGLFIRAGSESLQHYVMDYEIWAIQHNPGAPWGEF